MSKPSRKKEEIEICNVPRWQQIKASLNNYNFDDFTNAYKAVNNAVLIDVRTKAEFEIEHIEGAINLNYLSNNLADQLEKLDNSRSYFIYCRTGRRSLRVCAILRNLGFESVFNLENGIASTLNQ